MRWLTATKVCFWSSRETSCKMCHWKWMSFSARPMTKAKFFGFSQINFQLFISVSTTASQQNQPQAVKKSSLFLVGSTKRLDFDKRRRLCNLMMMRKKSGFDELRRIIFHLNSPEFLYFKFIELLLLLNARLLTIRVECRTSEWTCMNCEREEVRKKGFHELYDKTQKKRLEDSFLCFYMTNRQSNERRKKNVLKKTNKTERRIREFNDCERKERC